MTYIQGVGVIKLDRRRFSSVQGDRYFRISPNSANQTIQLPVSGPGLPVAVVDRNAGIAVTGTIAERQHRNMNTTEMPIHFRGVAHLDHNY
ncbi:hypothetical protein BA011_30980 (plasmid) [Rhizobium leguminosarum]|uniref:Uncharacterized protein n=1 Tax=Rhizobium leguminosarum TaxID=384 RepID=A0A1B1CKU1_RHILE|nr:hypothetical protein BA011_30980 [Rhizobium leguminosarum]